MSAATFGDFEADRSVLITRIMMTVQYSSHGICSGRTTTGTDPVSVTVIRIDPGLAAACTVSNECQAIVYNKGSNFDTSAPQCSPIVNGGVSAKFTITNTDFNNLALVATLDDSVACRFQPSGKLGR
jgi:hypothetical protein